MEKYVDGFVIPLAKEKIEDYRELAAEASKIWMELGALEYVECIGDDLASEHTKTFLQISGASPNETVVFAYIVYATKEDRDRVNAAIMEDPRIEKMMEGRENPFDPKRMAFGGFRPIVEASKE